MDTLIYNGKRLNFKGKSLSFPKKQDEPFVLLVDTTKQYSAADNPLDSDIKLLLGPNYEGYVYDFQIDWGDDSIEYYNQQDVEQLIEPWGYELPHTYDTPGQYQIKIRGIFGGLYYGWEDSAAKLLEVQQWGSTVWDSAQNAFAGCQNLQITATDIPNFQDVYSFESAFGDCLNMTNIPSNIFSNSISTEDFSYCFQNCISLQSIPSGLFDNTILVNTFDTCFENCESIQSIPNGLFDNTPLITTFRHCFRYCESIQSIPVNLIIPQNNPNVENFIETFRGLTNVSGLSPEVWKSWDNGNGLGYNGKPVLVNNSCFSQSTGFSDYNSIPSTWGGGAV